jgi:hypothetical protein
MGKMEGQGVVRDLELFGDLARYNAIPAVLDQ